MSTSDSEYLFCLPLRVLTIQVLLHEACTVYCTYVGIPDVHEELSSCDEHCGLGWLPGGMRGCFPGGSGSGLLGYTPLLGDGEPTWEGGIMCAHMYHTG